MTASINSPIASTSTLLDKLWADHEILLRDDGTSLLWVDRHLIHEGSHHAFAALALRNEKVAEPGLNFAVTDHYAPTRNRQLIRDESIARMMTTLATNTQAHGISLYDLDDSRQGIVHVIGPEQGITLPGLLINCGDSHTSTHGAFGTLAFGIGATEVAHVLATQTVWQKKPKAMRVNFNGTLGTGVTAKDMALHWIATYGTDGARAHAVEFAGDTVRSLSMEARMTLCNLSIEGGARFGLIAPDITTLNYLQGRPFAPVDDEWQQACGYWMTLSSDSAAHFDQEVHINVSAIAPTVTWGTSPEQAIGINQCIPDPANLVGAAADAVKSALSYMGLNAGQAIEGTPIDQIFLGSCTNARIEDMRIAASILDGRKACVPGLVSPGSTAVKQQAESEGLDRIFTNAGLEWAESGCSSCVAMNGDTVAPGNRCASTTNRNFKGRQGRLSRTHLMSPAMVAAAALHGKIVDVRQML